MTKGSIRPWPNDIKIDPDSLTPMKKIVDEIEKIETENEDTIKEITAYARLAGLKVVEGETAFNMQFMLQIMRGLEEYTNKSVNKVKTAAQEVLVKFHEDCIQVARDNLLESHVEEVGRIFAAVLIGKPYDQVTRDEVDAMLTAPEEDEDEKI